MVKRGSLNVPVIGVAKAGWNLDQLKAREGQPRAYGGLDGAAWEKLSSLLRYVDGDYSDPGTFAAVRKELGDAKRPAHYLAIPSVLFEKVVEQLVQSGSATDARMIVEKPFGHDLASARELNRILLSVFPSHRSSGLITISPKALFATWCRSASRTPSWSRSGIVITLRAY
jgi:glucose-6-phosphate 1-dehydrogenase